MLNRKLTKLLAAAATTALSGVASASLTPADIFTGSVALSIDGIGSNSTPVGDVQALIPVGSTILRAYLYSAGTPFPWYANSPQTLADYNSAGITLAGNPITNFSVLVGATSTRPEIGQFFTGRADVTALVTSLVGTGSALPFSWTVTEGSLNNRIDGEVLAIAYSNPAILANRSVALLDGGQNTGGETTTVNLGSPLAPGFEATMSIADTFSCCDQMSTIRVNGSLLTDFAGNRDDGLVLEDGSLITVGSFDDIPTSGPFTYATDRESYDLRPFLNPGDTSFTIFTVNETNDDNIFFMGLSLTGEITGIVSGVPEPTTLALLALGLAGLGFNRRRRS